MIKKIKHVVVLVNYKGWQDTIVCINSINKCKDAPHIIVVDNGSDNESVTELKKAFPNLDLIISQNVGFSAGNNLGIKRALRLGAKVVYLLNNDTVVDPNLFFRAFRYVAGKNRIAGGKIYYAKGYEFHETQKGKGNIIWYAGGHMDWSMGFARHDGVDQEDHGQYDGVRDVDFITGCFIAVPRQVFRKIGMFDEPLFLYLEDADYCLRALKAGIEIKYNSALVLYHRNSASVISGSSLVDYYITRNRFVIARRYASFRLFLALIREALFRNWGSPVRRMAFLDYLTDRMGNRNNEITQIAKK